VRKCLIESDVALPVVKNFIQEVQEESIGDKIIKAGNF
jgi:signal recognition particle GTPase